jgi:hypothetical protein
MAVNNAVRNSNGSLHRVFACSAGGPGFDSRLRRLVASVLPMLYAEDVGGPGQAPTILGPLLPAFFFQVSYNFMKRFMI